MRDYMNLGLRLFVICLVAALALAGVNSITKPIIDQQEKDKLNAARRELIAEAEDFTEVDFEFAKAAYPDVTEAYAAVAGGETIGYTVTLDSTGFGGKIRMSVGVMSDGTIAGLRIVTQTETEGLGARITEEAFYGQFAGLAAPVTLNQEVSAISGATISSTAVVKGVNTACEFVKALADPSLADPYKAVKDGYVMEDGNFCVTLGTEGFAGEVVLNVIVGADMNTVQGIEILSSNETAGLGAKASEPEFADQFKGIAAPVELGKNVDAISGATVTSTAVVSAVNLAVDYVKAKSAEFGTTPTYDPSAEASAPADSAEIPADAVEVKATGFGGEMVMAVGMDADGTITFFKVISHSETAGLGANAAEASFAEKLVGTKAPLEIGQNFDAISGATITSKAVAGAINELYESQESNAVIGGADGPTGILVTDGEVYSAEEQGFGGAIAMEIGMDADGTITSFKVTSHSETPGLGATAAEDSFAQKLIGTKAPVEIGQNFDAISGATITSNAIVKGINAVYDSLAAN